MKTEAIFAIAAKVTGTNAIKSLEQSLKDASNSGDRLKRSFAGGALALKGLFAALPVAGFAAWIRSSANFADNLNDISERTGVAVETLSKYAVAAEMGGSSIEEFANSLNKFNRNILEADNKTSKQASAFKDLGIKTRDAVGNLRSTEDILADVADAFANAEDGASKSSIAMDLFGKAGANIIPVLNQGSEGLTKFNKGVSDDFAKASDEFNDQLTIMTSNAGKFGNKIAETVLPSLTEMLRLINNLDTNIDSFWMKLGYDGKKLDERFFNMLDRTFGEGKKIKFAGSAGLNTTLIGDSTKKKELPYTGDKSSSATDALNEYIRAQKEEIQTLQMEAEYIGKTSIEIEKMKDARKIDQEFAAKTKDLSETAVRSYRKQTEAIKEQRQEIMQANYDARRSYAAGASDFFAKYVEAATDSAALIQNALTNAFDAVENSLVDFFTTGKLGIKDLANTIIKELIRVQIQKNIMAPLASLFGNGGGVSNFFSSFFADGGVMTSSGPLPLRKYASGGVANSPQMAIYGEGSTPEAYVPLPDGRRIPVAMQGGGNTNVNVVVNMDGATTARGDTPSGLDLGNLIAGVVKNTLVNEKRPGGLLAA